MLNDDVRPTTLQGVKRLAAQIKKEQRVKHASALELAARSANFKSYRHALRELLSNERPLARHSILLTNYWYDKDIHQRGRETLEVRLSKPIFDICSKLEFRRVGGFESMRMVAIDHFVSDSLAHSQQYARAVIGKAERTLRFMEHTGLRPSKDDRAAYPSGSHKSKLPDADHASNWVDPTSGEFVLVDEPYRGVPNEESRAEWARQHGWQLRKAVWPGMYFPYRCELYVAAANGGENNLDALMKRIDAIPAPTTDEIWCGDSVPSLEVFVSPAARTLQDRRRARSKGTVMPEASASTVPYRAMFGHSRRRPAGSMPVADHIYVGGIIKAVLHSSYCPNGVYQRMNSLRSTLEDWLALEIGRGQLEGPEFFDVYYHDPDGEGPNEVAAKSGPGLIRILGELKQKLQGAYPDCAPLREQIRRVDMSVALIAKMCADIS